MTGWHVPPPIACVLACFRQPSKLTEQIRRDGSQGSWNSTVVLGQRPGPEVELNYPTDREGTVPRFIQIGLSDTNHCRSG